MTLADLIRQFEDLDRRIGEIDRWLDGCWRGGRLLEPRRHAYLSDARRRLARQVDDVRAQIRAADADADAIGGVAGCARQRHRGDVT